MRPLEGIRVLEVAMYGFVPSAGAVLVEWGADVVKVEHAVTGDPQRGLRQTGMLRVEGDPNPNIEHANRGKRSIGLDMSVPEGKEVLYELARRSDVFLTSFLPGARQKFGIDVDDIRAVEDLQWVRRLRQEFPQRERGGTNLPDPGESPQPAEYTERFPHWRAALEAQFQVHRFLADEAGEADDEFDDGDDLVEHVAVGRFRGTVGKGHGLPCDG